MSLFIDSNVTDKDVYGLRKYAAACEMAYVKDGWEEFAEFKSYLNIHFTENHQLIPFYKDGGNHASAVDSLGGYIIINEYEVVVAFRGTEKTTDYWKEWSNDSDSHPIKRKFGNSYLLVHRGVNTEYERLRLDFIKQFSQVNVENKSLVFTGHSLGGMCQIAALDIVTNGLKLNETEKNEDNSSSLLAATVDSQVPLPTASFIAAISSNSNPIKIITFGALKIFSQPTMGSLMYNYLLFNSSSSSSAVADSKINPHNTTNTVNTTTPRNPIDMFAQHGFINIRVRFDCDPVAHYPCCRLAYQHVNNIDIILTQKSTIDHPIKNYRVFLNDFVIPKVADAAAISPTAAMKMVRTMMMMQSEGVQVKIISKSLKQSLLLLSSPPPSLLSSSSDQQLLQPQTQLPSSLKNVEDVTINIASSEASIQQP